MYRGRSLISMKQNRLNKALDCLETGLEKYQNLPKSHEKAGDVA